MRYTGMKNKVNKIDISELYKRTIYVLVTAMPYPQIWMYPNPFLICNNGIYQYYLGDDRYEVSEYL